MRFWNASLLSFLPLGLMIACGSATSNDDDATTAGGAAGSGAGTSAGGSSGSGGSGFGTGGSDTFQGCAKQTSGGELVPLDLYLMVDQSGSMQDAGKWDAVVAALTEFVGLPEANGIGVGLQYFPLTANPPPALPPSCKTDAECGEYGPCVPWVPAAVCSGSLEKLTGGLSSCEQKDYAKPEVPITVLPAASSPITASLAKHKPQGGTPSTAALKGAHEYAGKWAVDHPDHVVAVVLATDGDPSGCTTNTSATAAGVAKMANESAPSVKTFVIGVGNLPGLNQVAAAGGTDKAIIVDVGGDVTKQFVDALNAIRGAVACQYIVPKKTTDGQDIDPTLVNVVVTPEGGQPTILNQVGGVTECGNGGGWYYDNPASPKKILLCESECAKLKMSQKGSKVEVVYGCKTEVKGLPSADMTVTAVVLAAGQGTRMRSSLPKVLHPAAGRPIVEHVVHAALGAGVEKVVLVLGHGRELVEKHLRERFGDQVTFAVQEQQLGTGHATSCALPALPAGTTRVLVLCGDTPLLRAETLRDLVAVGDVDVAMLTTTVDEPRGYGRILRDASGRVVAIREEKDASPDERAIREINPGVYAFDRGFLEKTLPTLSSANAQGEVYLTDTIAKATTLATRHASAGDMLGVNDRDQLAEAERVLVDRIRRALRKAGATIREGAVVHADVVVEEDVTIDEGAVLRGKTRVGKGARIGVGAVLDDVVVAPLALVRPYSVLSQSSIGEGAQIGPFSHVRPGSDIHADAHIGNFVETKATTVRRGAKANHLAYLGDGDVGEGANVGAGTIFCNYDGFQKHRTTIGKGAFIGSDSQLVAPVVIGDGAYVATGTTVTKDVPADALAIARTKQENKEGYAPKLRARMAAAKAAAQAKK